MEVITRPDFARLPPMAQRLWCHLAAYANEEGVVENAREIRQAIGAGDDDVRSLIKTGLVLVTQDRKIKVVYGDRDRPAFMQIGKEMYMHTAQVDGIPGGLSGPAWLQIG